MTKEQAEFIQEACDYWEMPCEIRKGYSGRLMYGETTWAVVVPSVLEVLGAVVAYMKGFARKEARAVHTALEWSPQLDGLQWDHMGKSDIVLY